MKSYPNRDLGDQPFQGEGQAIAAWRDTSQRLAKFLFDPLNILAASTCALAYVLCCLQWPQLALALSPDSWCLLVFFFAGIGAILFASLRRARTVKIAINVLRERIDLSYVGCKTMAATFGAIVSATLLQLFLQTSIAMSALTAFSFSTIMAFSTVYVVYWTLFGLWCVRDTPHTTKPE